MQEGITNDHPYEDARHYGTIWYELLRNLLNWQERRAADYVASQCSNLLNHWLTHDRPCNRVLPFFVPESAREKVGNDYHALLHRLEQAIAMHLPPGWIGVPSQWIGECDWSQMKEECHRITQQYGYALSDCSISCIIRTKVPEVQTEGVQTEDGEPI